MLSCGTNTTAHRFLSRTSTQNTARYLTDVTADFKSDKNYDFIHQPTPGMISMDSIGFVYVPTRCAAGALCKLHIAFHGCNTGR